MPNTSNNLYTIKDISDITGIHPQTLRNWEREELLTPMRVAGNQRIYTDEHVARIKEIVALKEEGFQLKGVRNVLLGKTSSSNKPKSSMKQREAKPLMSAAQTLEKTKPKKKEPAKSEPVTRTKKTASVSTKKKTAPKMKTPKATTKKAPKPKYTVESLKTLSLKELIELGKKEKIRYFRQMNKGELVTALTDLTKREEIEMAVKAKTKGSSAKKEVVMAQENEQISAPLLTEEEDATNEGLVEANLEEDVKEEMDQQQLLIQQILQMGQSGKTPEEIAKQLAESAKK